MGRVCPAALFLLLIIACFSCRQYRYVYSPTKINTPLLQKKADSRLNVSFTGGGANGHQDTSRNSGLDVQSAYAITNHWGVMGSFHKRWEADDFRVLARRPFANSYIRYKRSGWEIGTGYFTGKNNANFSVYGGANFGRMELTDVGQNDTAAVYSHFFNTNSTNYFLQPGFTVGREGKVRFDFSVRYSLFQLRQVEHNYSMAELEYFNIQQSASGRKLLLREAAFTLSIPVPRTNWLRLETSYTVATLSQTKSYRQWCASIGLTADLYKLVMRKL